MKISKSLLQAIAIGLSLSAITSSCTKDVYDVEPIPEVEAENQTDHRPGFEKNDSNTCPAGGGSSTGYDCPACGLG
jgi:hypothetical protein